MQMNLTQLEYMLNNFKGNTLRVTGDLMFLIYEEKEERKIRQNRGSYMIDFDSEFGFCFTTNSFEYCFSADGNWERKEGYIECAVDEINYSSPLEESLAFPEKPTHARFYIKKFDYSQI